MLIRKPLVLLSISLALATPFAIAQQSSTGNPKGSVAPAAGDSTPKVQGATGPRVDTGRGTEPLSSEHGPVEARTGQNRPPGGGPNGGLTRTNPQDTAPSDNGRSAQGSSARPVPSSESKERERNR